MENGGLEPDLSEAVVPTPIAQLQPDLSDVASHIVDGEVTITWPFSIVTKSIAFKLAEHDFLLRRNKGQVRVEFHGAAGKAVSASGIGGGDRIRLCLVGVQWTEAAPASTRPDTLQWQMNFSSKLRLRLRRAESQEDEFINVDPSQSADNGSPLIEPASLQVSEAQRPATHVPDTPKQVEYLRPGPGGSLAGKRQASEAFDADEFASPAFLKRARVSYGSLFEGGFDIFDEHDDDLSKRKGEKKRPRFSMSANWRYTSRTPSPEPQRLPEGELEELEASNETPEVLVETPSRLPLPSKEKHVESIDGSLSSPVAKGATEAQPPPHLQSLSSPNLPKPTPEEAVRDETEQITTAHVGPEPSLNLPGLIAQDELEKTILGPISPLDDNLSKPHDIMDQFLHDSIDPPLNNEPGAAADLVINDDPGRFLRDDSLQFTPIPAFPENPAPTASFSDLPDGESHETESFTAFPTQPDDWLPMSSASIYPPVPAPNSLNNPVEIIDSSSSEGEQSPNMSDAEDEEEEEQVRGNSPRSSNEDSDHSHMEDSEQEALQQGREDFQMDDNKSEEGADVSGEDYDLRNYDDPQDDDDDNAESESEEDGPNTLTGAPSLADVGDEESNHSLNEHESLNDNDEEIEHPARPAGSIPLYTQADPEAGEQEEQDEEAGEEQEEEEVVVEEEQEVFDEEDEEDDEQKEEHQEEEESVYGSEDYHEEGYYEEGEEEYEEEEDETSLTPPPPSNPVFIDLLSDSEDEDEPVREKHIEKENEGDGGADVHEPNPKNLDDENPEPRGSDVAHTQGITNAPALENTEASEPPIPAHSEQSGLSPREGAKDVEDSVLTVPETMAQKDTQSPAQSGPEAATNVESHADSAKQSEETVAISPAQDQVQADIDLGEQSSKIEPSESAFQITKDQAIDSGEIATPLAPLSPGEIISQQVEDDENQIMVDVDAIMPPPEERAELISATDKEQAVSSYTSEPRTKEFPSTDATQTSQMSVTGPDGPAKVDGSIEQGMGKPSSFTTGHGSPDASESIAIEITTDITAIPSSHSPAVDSSTSPINDTHSKDSTVPSPPASENLHSAVEDIAMEDAPPVEGEADQVGSPQHNNSGLGEIEVKDGLVSPPATQASQQAKTTIEVAQPLTATIDIEDKIIHVDMERSEKTSKTHESQPDDTMKIDEIDEEHAHDAEYSFAAEQQIITESQEYQDKPMDDNLHPEPDVSTSAPAQSIEKDQKATTKPERDLLITVQSLRSRGHRKSLSSDSMSERNQDPSILLAKASTGAVAEPDRRRKQKTPPIIHTGRITRSKAEANVGQMAGPPHTPTRSTRHGATPETPHGSQTSGVTTRKGQSKSPASTSELLKTPSVADSSTAAAAVAAGDEQAPELKLRLLRDLRTNLGDFTALKSLRNLTSRTTDIFAIATTTPPQPSRPKNGPRDYMVELILTDPSCAPSTVVVAHFFRPHQASLPIVHAGDVVLLRRFQVVAIRKRGFGLRTADASAWAVFEKGDEEMLPQIKGPPVELSEAEVSYAGGLRRWWALLDEKVKVKIGKATEKAVQVANRDEK